MVEQVVSLQLMGYNCRADLHSVTCRGAHSGVVCPKAVWCMERTHRKRFQDGKEVCEERPTQEQVICWELLFMGSMCWSSLLVMDAPHGTYSYWSSSGRVSICEKPMQDQFGNACILWEAPHAEAWDE